MLIIDCLGVNFLFYFTPQSLSMKKTDQVEGDRQTEWKSTPLPSIEDTNKHFRILYVIFFFRQ